MDRAETGRRGEAAAARFYLDRGCRLLAHNYRTRMGELDLVLEEGDTVVLCEVKTRAANAVCRPAAAVTLQKQRRLIAAARRYLQLTRQSERSIRFDVAEVTPLPGGKWQVHIVRGAFECG